MRSRNKNQNLKLIAYARCVFGDRSNAAKYVMNDSTGSNGEPSSPSTVHETKPVTGITSR